MTLIMMSARGRRGGHGAKRKNGVPGTGDIHLTLVGGSLEYNRQMSPQRPAGTVSHQHGQADHLGYLERPFLEAQAALRARLSVR